MYSWRRAARAYTLSRLSSGGNRPCPPVWRPLGDGAQRVEAPGDGGEEPLLRLHVGGDRPEQRRLHLVGTVGAAEALDGGVGFPTGLQKIVHAQAPVPRAEIGVIATPGAAGVAEHQDALLVVLERLGLGEVGRPGPALDGKAPVAGSIHLGDDAARPAGDLGHLVGAEVLQDLIERARNRVQRGQVLDQLSGAQRVRPIGGGLYVGRAVIADGARRPSSPDRRQPQPVAPCVPPQRPQGRPTARARLKSWKDRASHA
jgi:hypothetical protein